MSMRKKEVDHVAMLQNELLALKEDYKRPIQDQPLAATSTSTSVEKEAGANLTFEDLSRTEQAAASLGVDPSSLRPIAFLNNGHYESLRKANVLDTELARRIEAYRVVASGSQN